MSSFLREKVSKNKRRYRKDGFDLDLTYITEKIIAMGFPSSKSEAYYRNPLPEVQKFFEHYHRDNYKLYNLCAERRYDASKFHNRVEQFPFFDHNAPPIKLIQDCCINMQEWLSDPKHIVGINCKAGKGRTGLIICCYLLHCGACETTDDALAMYGNKRTKDGKGVTIASQIRYIRYYERLLKHMDQIIPVPPKLSLIKLVITTSPKLTGNQYVIIEIDNHVTHISDETVVDRKRKNYEVAVNGVVEGDCKITLALNIGNKKPTKLCHFWFNTGFVEENSLKLCKHAIDVANKDKKCKVFKDDFAIEGLFGPCTEDTNREYDSSGDKVAGTAALASEEEKSGEDGRKARSKSFYDYDDYQNLPIEFSEDEPSDESDDGRRNGEMEKTEKMEKNEKVEKPEKEKNGRVVGKNAKMNGTVKMSKSASASASEKESEDQKRKSKTTLKKEKMKMASQPKEKKN